MGTKKFGLRAFTMLAALSTLSLGMLFTGSASAQEGFDGTGSGTATVTFQDDSDEAEISIEWEGLAAEIPDLSGTQFEALSNMEFPHAQHIHAGGEGRCQTPAEDTDGNGIVDTVEGTPAYGPVVVSLTEDPADTGPGGVLDVGNFPAGSSASYNRTVDLGADAETDAGTFVPAEQVRDGNAAIVIHGLDPAIMPGDTALEVSKLSDELPVAATAPALCGVLTETSDGTFTAQLSPVNPVAGAATDAAAPAPADGSDVQGEGTEAAPAPTRVDTGTGGLAAESSTSSVLLALVAMAAVAGLGTSAYALTRRRD